MLNVPLVELSYREYDNLSLAAMRGLLREQAIPRLRAMSLGPLLEMHTGDFAGLARLLVQPERVDLGGYRLLLLAVKSGVKRWNSSSGVKQGVFRLSSDPGRDEKQLMEFQVDAHKAAIASGFHSRISAQIVGAMGELASNIYEHAGEEADGLIAFSATASGFEFGAYDLGCGALKTIKLNPEFSHVRSHNEALHLCLGEGVSRHVASPERGRGFRPIFVGLANLNGLLRFRSGDGSLVIDGRSRNLDDAKIAKRVPINGMSISISLDLE